MRAGIAIAVFFMFSSCTSVYEPTDETEYYGFRPSVSQTAKDEVVALSVRSVHVCGPARGMLSYGDRILSINGYSVAGMKRAHYHSLFMDGYRANESMRFSIRRVVDALHTYSDVRLLPWKPPSRHECHTLPFA